MAKENTVYISLSDALDSITEAHPDTYITSVEDLSFEVLNYYGTLYMDKNTLDGILEDIRRSQAINETNKSLAKENNL